MSIKFIYMRNLYEIKYNKNDISLNDLFIKYASIINIKLTQLRFFYKGKNIILNSKKKLKELKDSNIIIFVYNIKIKKNKNTNNEDLKDIICPECKNLAIINNNTDKFSLNCHNNHKYMDLTINWFYKSQYINESLINCNKCGNNKSYYNVFYIDSNNKYFCPLCSEGNNNIVDYEYRFKICINHKKQYVSYCKTCNINLCEECENKHKKHRIIIYKDIKPSEKRIKEVKDEEIKINKYKEELKLLNKDLNDIINDLINEIDIYIKIYNNIIKNSNYLINYENIKTIVDFKAKELLTEINYYNTNEKNKLKNIINRYENNKFNKMNEIDIIYKPDKDAQKSKKIKLFGNPFVENNKKNCYLLINYQKYELCEYFKIEDINEKLSIKLIENKAINNMKNMFSKCNSLFQIPDFSNWNTNKVNNMSCMFSGCEALTSLPDISKFDTTNVTDMSYMFNDCYLLRSLPDISKWKTNNVTNMSNMFFHCNSFFWLPDISKWNTNNVINMSSMFCGCRSLKYLPDISKWNTNKVNNISLMFSECKSLKSLPDISKWNINNVNNMSSLFKESNLLTTLPDISKWNTDNVTNMNDIFSGCTSLLSLPDISNWNTKKVTSINSIFMGCISLSSLPQLSKWNLIKAKDNMRVMFYGCKKNLNYPQFKIQ